MLKELVTKLNDIVLKGKVNKLNTTILFMICYENGRFMGKDIFDNTKYEIENDANDGIYFPYMIYECDGTIYTYDIMYDIATNEEINSYITKWEIINFIDDHIDELLEKDRVIVGTTNQITGKTKRYKKIF